MGDKPGTKDRPASPQGDKPPTDPAARANRPALGKPDSPGSGTKNETWKEGQPAKPEQKGGGEPKGEGKGHGAGRKGGGEPKGGKGHGQTPEEWTGPRTPGGKPAVTAPTKDYDSHVLRLFRKEGKPAPPEGKGGHTTRADRKWVQHLGKEYGPPGHKFQASHDKPASQTPPDQRPHLRPGGSSENQAGGTPIRQENQVRRLDPTHRDPSSPNYTRPSEPRRGRGEAKPTEQKPGPAPEAKPKPPEQKPGPSPEAKPKPPEQKPGPSPEATPKPEAPKPSPEATPKVEAPKPSPEAPRSPEPPKSPEPLKPSGGPKGGGPAGGVEGLARKLGPLGIVGEYFIIRDVAREIEWLNTLSDPKWGSERTDMFGVTWYRSRTDPGTWWNQPDTGPQA